MAIPLAERLRPKRLSEYIGQQHLTGSSATFRRFIESGNVPSFILWGPPGVGKTTLAQIVATETGRELILLSAISSGVKDVREAIEKAKNVRFFDTPPPILFIDEIHRFSKSQQDSLLGAVEKGWITLIGATTENPSFEVIRPLLSRMQVYTLKPMGCDELQELTDRALAVDDELKKLNIKVVESKTLFTYSGGDARKLLNILDVIVASHSKAEEIVIDDELVSKIIKENPTAYDKGGEMHYDTISAFIKSIRGSDPDAAIYYLARMIAAGEDPKFIARRLVISASEDVGLANPNAMLLANACFESVSNIGMPEGRIPLAETTIYLATSPKSNAAYMAINRALAFVKSDTNSRSIPMHLRNAPTSLMKELGYGDDYKYAHDYEGSFVRQQFLPEGMESMRFYTAGKNAKEREIERYMKSLWGDYKL